MLWSDLERVLDPWREVEITRRPRFARPSVTEFPPVNVWISSDTAVVTTELPGVEAGNIDISVVEKTLSLRGTRGVGELKEGETYHRRERWQGNFSKTVTLPFPVQADKVDAKFSKGVLSIALPRAESDKPRKIAVKSV